jgi:hypothetical protein
MTHRFEEKANGQREQVLETADQDFELEQALKNFKSSVCAWSEAELSRPRKWTREVRHRSWRLALGWSMGCALVAGTVSGGLLERHQKLEAARTVAEQQAAERQKQLVEQRATVAVTDEALLAGVDSDVSREVPSAMEPLAQMMSYDGSK